MSAPLEPAAGARCWCQRKPAKCSLLTRRPLTCLGARRVRPRSNRGARACGALMTDARVLRVIQKPCMTLLRVGSIVAKRFAGALRPAGPPAGICPAHRIHGHMFDPYGARSGSGEDAEQRGRARADAPSRHTRTRRARGKPRARPGAPPRRAALPRTTPLQARATRVRRVGARLRSGAAV